MKPNKYNYNNQTGMYRNKIIIEKFTTTVDELFQEIEGYTPFKQPWAMIKTSENDETLENAKEQTKLVKRFIVKYSKDLRELIDTDATRFRVIYQGVEYDVKKAFDDNELHDTITIHCEGRV